MNLFRNLVKLSFNYNNVIKNNLNNNLRLLSTTKPQQIKEIQINQDGNILTIQGVTLPSPRSNKILNEIKCNNEKFCPECTLGLQIKHTDVLILSQYVRSDGCMLPRRITGLCRRQQKRISSMVTMAQKAGLMPNLNPSYSNKDPKKRYQWKKFNKYFDEKTIKELKSKIK